MRRSRLWYVNVTEQLMHCTRSPQARHATKHEKPRRLCSSITCSPASSFSPIAVEQPPRERGLLARFQELRRISISSTSGMGRFSTRSGKFEQRVLAALDVVAALEAGRRRPEHDARVRLLRAHHRDVAAVVSRRFLLLIAAVVLFVDDDEAEILHRREDAGSCPDHHARVQMRMRRHCSARSAS